MFEALYVKSPSGITNPAGLAKIIPRGLFDDFNRADSVGVVGPSSGEGKVPVQVGQGGTALTTSKWGIKTNRLSLAVPAAAAPNPLALWDMGTVNGKLSGAFRRSPGNQANAGLVFAYIDPNNWMGWVGRYGASNYWSLYQFLGGVGSYIWQGTSVVTTTGDVPYVRRVGTAVQLGVGATVLYEHTLAGVFANAGRLAGVWGAASTTSGDDVGFDNLTFAPINV